MLGDSQPKAGSFVLGGEISLENLIQKLGGDAGTVIGDGQGDHVLRAGMGGNGDCAFALEGFAPVCEEIHEDFVEMAALHHQGRERLGKVLNEYGFVGGTAREDLVDGAIDSFGEAESFDFTFGELGVTHELGNDLVGALDFFPDNADLLARAVLGIAEGFLKGKGGVVGDAKGVFELVRDLGGEAAGGLELVLAGGEFAAFIVSEALLLEQNLHAKTADREEPEHEHTESKGFGGVGTTLFLRQLRERNIEHAGQEIAAAKEKIEDQLGARERQADGIADDESEEQPIDGAVKAAGAEGKCGQEKSIDTTGGKDEPLKP